MSAVATAIVGSAVMGGIGASKAAKAGKVTPKSVDVNQLNTDATKLAGENARASIALENELTPEVAQLRSESINALLGDMGGEDAYTNLLRDRYSAILGGQGGGDLTLLRAANDRAAADLALGGEIPLDVRNQVTRLSAANAAGSMGRGLNLGRDLAARDLGLTSLQLRDNRLTNALSSGNAYFNAGQGNLANQVNALSGMNNLSATGFGRRQALATLGQSIERPQLGLSQGSIADIAIGNTNASNAAAQQNAAVKAQMWNSFGQLGGQLAGAGLGYMGNQTAPVATGGTNSYIAPAGGQWKTSALGGANYNYGPVTGFNSSFR